MFTIGSATVGHVQKHDEHCDGALLSLANRFHQLLVSAESGLEVKRSIAGSLSPGFQDSLKIFDVYLLGVLRHRPVQMFTFECMAAWELTTGGLPQQPKSAQRKESLPSCSRSSANA